MAEYIEREAILREIERRESLIIGDKLVSVDAMKSFIKNRPAADVAPVRKWISVKDRLPEEKVNCIVNYKHAYCDTDGYWAIGFCYYDGEKFKFNPIYKITHWMPLPEPPKEE